MWQSHLTSTSAEFSSSKPGTLERARQAWRREPRVPVVSASSPLAAGAGRAERRAVALARAKQWARGSRGFRIVISNTSWRFPIFSFRNSHLNLIFKIFLLASALDLRIYFLSVNISYRSAAFRPPTYGSGPVVAGSPNGSYASNTSFRTWLRGLGVVADAILGSFPQSTFTNERNSSQRRTIAASRSVLPLTVGSLPDE